VLGTACGGYLYPENLHCQEMIISCTDSSPPPEKVQSVDITSPSAVPTTGDSSVDRVVREAIIECYKFFLIHPAFYFVFDVNNAYANTRAFLGQSTGLPGHVAFGIPYLKQSLKRDPNGNDALRIIAHEFSHILQYNALYPDKRRLYDILRPEKQNAKLVELHADYMSGVYLATRYTRNPQNDMFALNSTIEGDNNTSYSNHHGTTDERRRALREGFKIGLSFPPRNNVDVFDVAFGAAAYVISAF
jgi:hypothetical protein